MWRARRGPQGVEGGGLPLPSVHLDLSDRDGRELALCRLWNTA